MYSIDREIRHELLEDFRREARQRRPAVALADPAEAAPRAESAHVLLAFEALDEVLESLAHLCDIVSAEPRRKFLVAETQDGGCRTGDGVTVLAEKETDVE